MVDSMENYKINLIWEFKGYVKKHTTGFIIISNDINKKTKKKKKKKKTIFQ